MRLSTIQQGASRVTRMVAVSIALVVAAGSCPRATPVNATTGVRARLPPGGACEPATGDLVHIFQPRNRLGRQQRPLSEPARCPGRPGALLVSL